MSLAGSGGIGLVARHGRGSGAGPAHRQAVPYLVRDGNELRDCLPLPRGQNQSQRSATPVGGRVDLAGLPTEGPAQEAGPAPTTDTSAFYPPGVAPTAVSVLFPRRSPPFFRAASSRSSAASSRAATTS